MVELTARTPADGMLPLEIGRSRLSEVVTPAITWVKVLNGGRLQMPAPGRVLDDGERRWLSVGPGQAMALGAPLSADPGVAISDQSDAWALLRLEGPDTRDVLARLTSIDLRASRFGVGQTARTLLGHMSASITPVAEDAFDVMVFRSMAASAVHDLKRAMDGIAERYRTETKNATD